MKANEAPEKIFVRPRTFIGPWPPYIDENSKYGGIEYTQTDAFIEKTLKWYCRDCECNDNCKDSKCFFYQEYERYLKGYVNAIPPKFSNVILNEDGSTSDDWYYRHFIKRMQDAFIEKACKYLEPIIFSMNSGDRPDTDKFIEDFKKYMKGERQEETKGTPLKDRGTEGEIHAITET